MELYNYASLTTGKQPRLEASAKASGEIGNIWFSPRQEPGASVPPIDPDTFWSHEFPPHLDHQSYDQEITTMCCQVHPNYFIPVVIDILILTSPTTLPLARSSPTSSICIITPIVNIHIGMPLNTQAKVFFLALEEGRKPLRGAICNVTSNSVTS